jgi:predicted nuclease with TOPRIM domain
VLTKELANRVKALEKRLDIVEGRMDAGEGGVKELKKEVDELKDKVEGTSLGEATRSEFDLKHINSRDGDGRTNLHNAVRSQNVDLATRLIKCQADVNMPYHPHLMTPLHDAAERGTSIYW